MNRLNGRALSLVFGMVASTFVSVSANAENLLHFTFSAGVRESFVNNRDHSFGGDNMARTKRHLVDLGFGSFTVTLRLGMNSAQDSIVYSPPLRTLTNDLDVFMTRTAHSQSEVILKPIIGKNPGLGVIQRLTNIRPVKPALWFASYHQSINTYLATAARKKIAEFVLAVGMHSLWTPEHADAWILLAKEARRQIGSQTRLSIELSSREDLKAFENWRSQSPQTYALFLDQLDRIRVAAEVGSFQRDLSQARELFGGKPLTLAHLVVPACSPIERDENEIQCHAGAPDVEAFARQKLEFNKALDELESLPTELLSVLKQVEIFYATTDAEPAASKTDPRLLIFNPGLKAWLKVWRERHAQVSTSFHTQNTQQVPTRLVCLYFDEENSNEIVGSIQSRLLENLLGGFPNWKVRRGNVKIYNNGDANSCDALFYLATHFTLDPPGGFYQDVAELIQTKPVVWMNYRFEDFQKEYKIISEKNGFPPIAFSVPKIEQSVLQPSPSVPDPGFYRYFDYKGETFEKLAYWDPISNNFASSPELNLITIKNNLKVKVLATARHSSLQSEVPYAVLQIIDGQEADHGSLWYFADSPFSFVHYEDRYLILCDLLWDILGETPPKGPPVALVRIEDVNPALELRNTRWAVDYLSENKIPHSLAVIPYYSNLFMDPTGSPLPALRPSIEYPEFTGFLRYAKARGSEFVFHGMAHQAGDLISGYDGSSGDDYEFWLYPENQPHPQDSSDFVIDQLERGEAVFTKAGIRPVAWEVPHYAASALDFILFGKLFTWNYHRALYFKGEWSVDSLALTEKHRFFDCTTDECRRERREVARKINLTVDYRQFGGQFFPFPIYRDSYGQSVIPETLGMVDWAFFSDDTFRMVSSPDDLLRRARKLKVVRGAYASFFWHSELLNPDLIYYKQHPESYETVGGKNTLIRLVQGLKKMGYQFRSVSDCSLFPQVGCKKIASR